MNAKQIVQAVQDNKGQNVQAIWRRTMKTRADVPMTIEKETSCFVRAGIDYANLASVKQGIESGERGEIQPLKWGTWAQFPFIITHTPKGTTEQKEYVRLYPATFENLKKKTVVRYFVDGKLATEEEVKPFCLASEFRERDEEAVCFTIKAESLIALNGENNLS